MTYCNLTSLNAALIILELRESFRTLKHNSALLWFLIYSKRQNHSGLLWKTYWRSTQCVCFVLCTIYLQSNPLLQCHDVVKSGQSVPINPAMRKEGVKFLCLNYPACCWCPVAASLDPTVSRIQIQIHIAVFCKCRSLIVGVSLVWCCYKYS